MGTIVGLLIIVLALPSQAFEIVKPSENGRLYGGAITKLTGGATVYMPIGGEDVNDTAIKAGTPFSSNYNFTKLTCTVDNAPLSTEVVTMTLQTGTCGGVLSDTTLSCAIVGSAVKATDNDVVAVSSSQCGVIKTTYSSSAVTSTPRYALEIN